MSNHEYSPASPSVNAEIEAQLRKERSLKPSTEASLWSTVLNYDRDTAEILREQDPLLYAKAIVGQTIGLGPSEISDSDLRNGLEYGALQTEPTLAELASSYLSESE